MSDSVKLERGSLRRSAHESIHTQFVEEKNADLCAQKRFGCGRIY